MALAAEPVDVFLSPGEHFVGDAQYRVHTLLGSCVSITLWHARWHVGAMSHFLLAERGSHSRYGALDGRYGGEALVLMERDLAARGIAAADCEARLFGGADMFPGNACSLHVGRRNGETARALLSARGIRVVGDNLFGHSHRRLVFDIATGLVSLRGPDEAGDSTLGPLVTRPGNVVRRLSDLPR